MTGIINRRMTAQIEGDFVVFLIGARLNRPWKLLKMAGFGRWMPRMLTELQQKPELGLLGFEVYGVLRSVIVQYWRSWEHLEAFARSPESTHHPAWRWFNQAIGSGGDFGIWHETYLVRAGDYEAIYNNMPPRGLGRAAELVPASGRLSSASERLGRQPKGEAPEDAFASNGDLEGQT